MLVWVCGTGCGRAERRAMGRAVSFAWFAIISRRRVLLLCLFAAPVNRLLTQQVTISQPQLVYDGDDGQIDLAPGVTRVAVDARGVTFVSDWRRGGLFAFGPVANSPRRIGSHGPASSGADYECLRIRPGKRTGRWAKDRTNTGHSYHLVIPGRTERHVYTPCEANRLRLR